MMSGLAQWQDRLHRHYSQLRRQRGSQVLFALEHGLNQTEFGQLRSAVHRQISIKRPSPLDGLTWIAYAAEIGYEYSGDEYWQTFEQLTPGWAARGDRGWLREQFEWFHKKYGGAAPSGAWAEHFSIICWPITHAILPRDLQQQLARILYELRHSFSAHLFESPDALGELIAARSWNATSRFRNFAEEPQFVGQISMALLLQGEHGTSGFLHRETLQRIGADLDRERTGRGWLKSARQFAKEQATVRGLSIGSESRTLAARRAEEPKSEVAALGIEPSVLLRPKDARKTAWEVCLEIPDMSHLLERFPKARDVLAESRCTVTGSAGRPLARGHCLYGSCQVVLNHWPQANEVLLQFERSDPQVDSLLRTECLLRPGPQWLFRIASDGLAYELRTLRVRRGQQYVLMRATTEQSLPQLPGVSAVTLACKNVAALVFSLPEALDSTWEETLRHLGLRQARLIEVWPAGIAPAVWDGEGHGEWLASERPYLGVSADHSVSAIVVSIEGEIEDSLLLDDIVPGRPEFIELPRLPVGLHKIKFSTRQRDRQVDEAVGDLDVVMRIRESRPWVAGASPQGPLLVRTDPAVPTLEELWDGRADIAIDGPRDRNVRCQAALFQSDLQKPTVASFSISLPVVPTSWEREFTRHCRTNRQMSNAYDMARSCELRFTADELGAFSLRCERDFTPLRWAVQFVGTHYAVRLLNDSGDTAPPTLAWRTFERPCTEEAVKPVDTFKTPSTGGMYLAHLRGRTDVAAAIILPPIEEVLKSLKGLGCNPQIDDDGTLTALRQACDSAALWSGAKLAGNELSATRLRQVLSAIDQFLITKLCGAQWKQLEAEVVAGKTGLGYLQQAVWRNRGHESDAASRLSRSYQAMSSTGLPERVREFARIIRPLVTAKGTPGRSPTFSLEQFAEFALRVASHPAAVGRWVRANFGEGIAKLQETPVLIRAARYLVLAIDRHLESRVSGPELFAGWRWQ